MGTDRDADVDILIVGAGVTGIYQLYLAREAGYSAQVVEQGGGVELPFGGFRKSGYGREKGVEALDAYTATKTIVVQL